MLCILCKLIVMFGKDEDFPTKLEISAAET